ncbi:MAG: PKD domain-containing protein, partial [Candidatus Bathycorpusculaceae bacterium]
TYYRVLVEKIGSLSRELGVTPFRYAGEFKGTGLAISDAAQAGITSFLIELTDRAVPSSEIEAVILPRFKPVAAVLSLENPTDTLPPTTLEDYDDLWHNEDFAIILTATDDASGVFETYYRINDGPVNNVSVNGQPHITTEGANNTLEYWSLDKAGNEELPHRILTGIKLDKTPPEANAGQDKIIAVGTTVTFKIQASDNIGIVSYDWDFGDGTRLLGETANHTYTHAGNYTLTLTIRDAAKNSATASINVTVLLDTDGDGAPNVADTDDDEDGLPDTWEEANGLNPLDPKDASLDPDGDGLTNFQEYQKNTDPNINSSSASSWIASAAAALALVAILIFARASASRKRMSQEKSARASFE